MSRICRILVELCWAGGLLSVVAAVVLKFMPAWRESLAVSPLGGLTLASALFLAALATREMESRTN